MFLAKEAKKPPHERRQLPSDPMDGISGAAVAGDNSGLTWEERVEAGKLLLAGVLV